jgi:hypothetical protein
VASLLAALSLVTLAVKKIAEWTVNARARRQRGALAAIPAAAAQMQRSLP